MDFRAILASPFIRVKLVTCVHFILITNALLSNWTPTSYLFYNILFFVSLFWGIHCKESADAIQTAILIDAFSVINDLICIIGYFSIYNGWSIAFAIINLIIRPFSVILLHRELAERGGTIGPSSIFPTTEQRSYEDIDRPTQSVPTNTAPTGPNIF